jgi:hypothetical protein
MTLISQAINILQTIKSITSEKGHVVQIPVSPQKTGKINIAGIKNKTCLARVITVAGRGLPIAWKRVPDTNWNPSKGKEAVKELAIIDADGKGLGATKQG